MLEKGLPDPIDDFIELADKLENEEYFNEFVATVSSGYLFQFETKYTHREWEDSPLALVYVLHLMHLGADCRFDGRESELNEEVLQDLYDLGWELVIE
jgi:hypothetical protein